MKPLASLWRGLNTPKTHPLQPSASVPTPPSPALPALTWKGGPQESSLSEAEQKETGMEGGVCRSHLGLESRGWAQRSSKRESHAPHDRAFRNLPMPVGQECPVH